MATRPALRIPTAYVPAADLAAWMASAAPGDVMLYAVGPALDAREPAAAMVAQWIRDRLVEPFKDRDGATGALQHRVRRVRPPVAGPVRRIVRDAEFEATEAGKVFLLLVRLANVGMVCPSNREIAERTGLRDADAARYRINQLIEMGRIRIDNPSGACRIVTILATGKRTADKGTK